MPHSFCISGSPPVVVARLEGRVDLIYLQWVLYEAVCQGRIEDVRRYLIDLRQCHLDLTEAELYPNARYIASELPDGAQVSAIVRYPDAALQRFAESLSETASVKMSIAPSEEQAAEWLYRDDQNAAYKANDISSSLRAANISVVEGPAFLQRIAFLKPALLSLRSENAGETSGQHLEVVCEIATGSRPQRFASFCRGPVRRTNCV